MIDPNFDETAERRIPEIIVKDVDGVFAEPPASPTQPEIVRQSADGVTPTCSPSGGGGVMDMERCSCFNTSSTAHTTRENCQQSKGTEQKNIIRHIYIDR